MKSRHQKVGHVPTHAHTRRLVGGKPPEKSDAWWRVESYFPVGFSPTCRSALCASESKVSGQRRVGWKIHQRQGDLTTTAAARRSDDRGFQNENKVTGRKHDHQKKIRFSLLALIPCEERKGRIPNFIIFTKKKLPTTLHIGLRYIYMLMGPIIQ